MLNNRKAARIPPSSSEVTLSAMACILNAPSPSPLKIPSIVAPQPFKVLSKSSIKALSKMVEMAVFTGSIIVLTIFIIFSKTPIESLKMFFKSASTLASAFLSLSLFCANSNNLSCWPACTVNKSIPSSNPFFSSFATSLAASWRAPNSSLLIS